MKNLKLNKKGFTLIELLAVIVILAIIMVVTIPTVLNTMSKARTNQLQNAADSVSEWFAKQYELAAMGNFAGGAEASFNTFVNNLSCTETNGTKSCNGTYQTLNGKSAAHKLDSVVLTAGGVSNAEANIDLGQNAESYVYYNTSNGRMCVVLTAKDGGSFYVNASDGVNKVCSSGCDGDCTAAS